MKRKTTGCARVGCNMAEAALIDIDISRQSPFRACTFADGPKADKA